MSDTEIRMMRYTIEQLSAELQTMRQYVSDIEPKLERTRKALGIAVDALKRIAGTNKECDIGWKMIEMKNNAHDTLNQIKTALEQKE